MTPSEVEPATFWLVARCLNQLRHRVPHVSQMKTLKKLHPDSVQVGSVRLCLKTSNTSRKPKFNIVLHNVCPKRSVLGVFRACAKLRKRLRQERLYDEWNWSTTYSMYITSGGLRVLTCQHGQTQTTVSLFYLTIIVCHVPLLFRRECGRSAERAGFVR